MRRYFTSSCTTAAVIALATVGCTGDNVERNGSAEPRKAVGAVRDQGRELTDAERARLGHAEALLVKRCMEGQGFRYWVRAWRGEGEALRHGYVLTDVTWARKHGYGGRIEKELMKEKLSNPNIAYRNQLTEEDRARYVTALGRSDELEMHVTLPGGQTVGSTIGGCQAEAQRRLYGDPRTWFRVTRVTDNLTPLYVPDIERDPRFRSAQRAWSACMHEAGHRYASPGELRSDLPRLSEGVSPETAHTIEVRLAVREAECAARTSLGKTARSLEREYSREVRRRYRDEIDTRRRMELAALARAAEITSS
ncbi:hypothetical protein [Streptomyces sp. PR69]|uniref:hypothetical protein n=1 Tax=Streptomyces sp. PR69 TaxID=2984950 RepID=UPI00226453CA|nr:hypothetical protein [Streptomyces sp. PR69]